MNGWRCPKCGSNNLEVQVTLFCNLIQTLDRNDGIEENEWRLDSQPDEKMLWDNDSPMACNTCAYEALTSHFINNTPIGCISVTKGTEFKERRT